MRETSTLSVLFSFGLVALVAALFHEAEASPRPAVNTAKAERIPAKVERIHAVATTRTSRISLAGQSQPRVSRLRERTDTPASEFTTVLKGESLADIAERVYGSRELDNSLWRSNRDQVDRLDSPLHENAILRTPRIEISAREHNSRP